MITRSKAQEREIITKHEPDPERRRTLFMTAILTALAQNVFDSDFLWNFFKEPNMLLADDPFLNRLFNERYGPKLVEAEAKAEAKGQARAKAEADAEIAKIREHARQMEEGLHQARAEAEAKAEIARREAEIKAQAEVSAREQWLKTVSKFLIHRFSDNVPLQVLLDLQCVSASQRSQVIDLALDAPDLATFRQQLKAMVSDNS